MNIRKISIILLALYAVLTTYAVVSLFCGVAYLPILTPLSSLLAFAFAALHGSQRLGWPKSLLLLGLTFLVSLAFESLGVATGWVYGQYHYTEKLGYKFLGLVPLIIPVAWFMMSYPSFIIAARILPAGRRLWRWRLSVAALGSVIMTAWDLAMDPMMVASGHWVWDQPGAYFDIPLQNYWGWWLTIFVTFLLFLLIGRVTPSMIESREPDYERLAVWVYATAGLGSIIVDFHTGLGGPALVGLFAMAPWAILGWLGREPNSAILMRKE